MQEIISLNVGSTGCFLGGLFYKGLCDDTGITKEGNYKGIVTWDAYSGMQMMRNSADVYFNELTNSSNVHDTKYSPRTIFINTSTSLLDYIKQSDISQLFKDKDQQFLGNDSNYRGFNTFHNAYNNQYKLSNNNNNIIMDNIRKYSEQCDRLQGFQFINNFGGGTGSGITCKILENINDNYSDKFSTLFSVLPSTQLNNISLFESFNTCFALDKLLKHNKSQMITFSNDAIYSILKTQRSIQNEDSIYYKEYNDETNVYWNNFNNMIAHGILQSTTSYRFPLRLNETMLRMSINLLPFPRLKFYILSCSPWWNMPFIQNETFKYIKYNEKHSKALFDAFINGIYRSLNSLYIPLEVIKLCQAYYAPNIDSMANDGFFNIPYHGTNKIRLTVQEITDEIWSTRNCVSGIKMFDDGKFMSASFIYRGGMSTPEVDDETAKNQQKLSDDFVHWLPSSNNYKMFLFSHPTYRMEMSAYLLANNTAMRHRIYKYMKPFENGLIKKKVGLNKYLNDGLENDDLEEIKQNLNNLINEYEEKTNVVVDLDDDDDDDDEDDEDEEDEDDDDDDDEDDEDEEEEEEDEDDSDEDDEEEEDSDEDDEDF